MRRSLVGDPASGFAGALVAGDFERLTALLATDVRMRALIPPGPVELSGAADAGARFASWFGGLKNLELVRTGSDEVGDRLHIFYRLRVNRRDDPTSIVEQHVFCALAKGRITALDLVCSGFRPE
ncbi:MAG TPA: nuclear transport factor 2 family protein [Gaiellaceae bacterium]|nr:nuclear transport factor 2 family protein [Gaiellaceae bacterium]